jgi:hypothetical protein
VMGPFFHVFVKFIKYFYHQESTHYLQIKYNKKFMLQRKKLHHNLSIFCFCHYPREIAKEEE